MGSVGSRKHHFHGLINKRKTLASFAVNLGWLQVPVKYNRLITMHGYVIIVLMHQIAIDNLLARIKKLMKRYYIQVSQEIVLVSYTE